MRFEFEVNLKGTFEKEKTKCHVHIVLPYIGNSHIIL